MGLAHNLPRAIPHGKEGGESGVSIIARLRRSAALQEQDRAVDSAEQTAQVLAILTISLTPVPFPPIKR